MNWLFNIFFLILFVPFCVFGKVEIPRIEPGKPLPANLFIQIAKKINPSVVNISTTISQSSLSNRCRNINYNDYSKKTEKSRNF